LNILNRELRELKYENDKLKEAPRRAAFFEGKNNEL